MSGAQQKTPPDPSDIEVSIFGPGFGESILVHVGDSRWIVVDSCIDRQAKKPASLVYFEEIGCNPEKCVDRIVATHWHDDHIAGIDSVIERCPNAQFWVSDALQSTEFLKLIDPKFTRPDLKFTRGANTIARVVERIGRDFRWAVAATRIFQATVTAAKVPVEAWALSPSHHENLLAKQAIGSLIPNQTTPQRRIPDRSPNHASVALVVIIGNDHVLLGADLEEAGNPKLGWSAVLADPNRPAIADAEVFKVPHHASETGHHPNVWTNFLCKAPHAVVTPWTLGGGVLPTSKDVKRILGLTNTAYISKERLLQSHMRRTNMVEKILPRSLRSITKKPGHIRLRKRIGAPQGGWQVVLFDGANTLDRFQTA